MNRNVTVRCPYCGCEAKVKVTEEFSQKTVVTCDIMDGGCDQDFVVDIRVSIDAKVLKIEGGEKKSLEIEEPSRSTTSVWEFAGMKKIFDTHGGDSELNCRSGQTVDVIRLLTKEEADLNETGPMYRIRFLDGYETDAFADELREEE